VPVSTRVLTVITVVLLVAVVVAAIAAWWITRQPPLTPVPIPSVSIG
jgi:Na+/serine symporter